MNLHRSLSTAEVTFFPSKEARPGTFKTVSLASMLLSDDWKDRVLAVREETDPKRQAALKHALPCFTPSGTFKTLKASGLVEHSGFICLDLDQSDNAGIENFRELKQHVHALRFVAYCGLSCRGNGFFLVVPIADPSKHREYYRALEADFARAGLKLDPSCRDVCRKRFVSYDPEPYVNPGAAVYDYTLPGELSPDRVVVRRPVLPDGLTVRTFHESLRQIEDLGLDITEGGDYQRMRQIATGIVNAYGEGGRPYVHRIFSHFEYYDASVTNDHFDALLEHIGEYAETLAIINSYTRQAKSAADAKTDFLGI